MVTECSAERAWRVAAEAGRGLVLSFDLEAHWCVLTALFRFSTVCGFSTHCTYVVGFFGGDLVTSRKLYTTVSLALV